MAHAAAVITEHGRPPGVRERDLAARADATLIAVAAAPITPLDVLCAGGKSYFGPPALPYVPGVQGVGTVLESRHLEAGTPVWFATDAGMRPGDGSMAGRCIALDTDIVALPAEADPFLVAALGFSAVAAWMAVTRRGALQAGETVIVLGAGGVVGQVAVQVARLSHAGRVVAACRFPAAAVRARELGADDVVLLDTDNAEKLTERFLRATDGGADLVIDPLFGTPAEAAFRALKPTGRLVNFGGSAAPTATLDSATLRGRSLRLIGYTNNELTPDQRNQAVAEVVALAVDGRLNVDYDRVPLADVAEAWSRQAAGTQARRFVVTM
jgi:NADPH:quinone reductase-like Zn-dependent oxidoreductase